MSSKQRQPTQTTLLGTPAPMLQPWHRPSILLPALPFIPCHCPMQPSPQTNGPLALSFWTPHVHVHWAGGSRTAGADAVRAGALR